MKLRDWGFIFINVCLASIVAILLSWIVPRILVYFYPSSALKDWALLVPAIIVSVGWYITAKLNHKNKIAEKRLECRLKMLEFFLPIATTLYKHAKNPELNGGQGPFTDIEFARMFEKAQVDFKSMVMKMKG